MLATAADVPPELFDHILDYFGREFSIIRTPERRTESKRALSQCSLTCRFWASRCQPRIFEHITLRSLEDVNTLLGFPHTIRQYITDLSLDEKEPCIPWTHHVYSYRTARTPVFSRAMSLAHILDGACTPTSVRTLRSLHHSLPRRTPILYKDSYPLFIRSRLPCRNEQPYERPAVSTFSNFHAVTQSPVFDA